MIYTDALEKGKKDGEIIIKNISPKTTGGKHEVIDETLIEPSQNTKHKSPFFPLCSSLLLCSLCEIFQKKLH